MDYNINITDCNINEKLDYIIKLLEEIKLEQSKISVQTEKMESHIEFINNEYSIIKKPLNYILDTANSIKNNGMKIYKNIL
jgi:hypothetical protein